MEITDKLVSNEVLHTLVWTCEMLLKYNSIYTSYHEHGRRQMEWKMFEEMVLDCRLHYAIYALLILLLTVTVRIGFSE